MIPTEQQNEIDRMKEARRNVVSYNGHTHGELDAAFDRVKDGSNWKMPIDATLPAGTSDAELRLIEDSIVYFCGSVAETARSPDGSIRIRADGYYHDIGA